MKEYGVLEREIEVDAPPEVVFAVVSEPEHISRWWTDDADVEAVPGTVGELVWGDRAEVAPMVVERVEPPRLFSFRWCHPDGKVDAPTSLLVTFELSPWRGGTKLRLTETGFREMGWTAAKVAEQYREHETGWDVFVPRLGAYAGSLGSRR